MPKDWLQKWDTWRTRPKSILLSHAELHQHPPPVGSWAAEWQSSSWSPPGSYPTCSHQTSDVRGTGAQARKWCWMDEEGGKKAYCNSFGSSLETTKVQDPRKKPGIDFSEASRQLATARWTRTGMRWMGLVDRLLPVHSYRCYSRVSKALLLSIPGVLRREEENGWMNLVQGPR